MSSHPVVTYPDPVLARAAIRRPLDPALRETGRRLLDTARAHNAYGLAAAHIGAVAPVVVVSLGPMEQRDYRLLFNPVILSRSGTPVTGPEGSVSLPGIEVDVLRAPEVLVGYDDETGSPGTLDLTGFAARVAQHEIDQMEGTFFLTRISRLKRDAALRRFRKLSGG